MWSGMVEKILTRMNGGVDEREVEAGDGTHIDHHAFEALETVDWKLLGDSVNIDEIQRYVVVRVGGRGRRGDSGSRGARKV
jgi:hypothetical protein